MKTFLLTIALAFSAFAVALPAHATPPKAKQCTLIKSVGDWKRVSTETRDSVLTSQGYGDLEGVLEKEYKSVAAIRNAKTKRFAEKMLKQALSDQPDKDGGDFDERITIGEPTATFTLYELADGTVLGGRVFLHQLGTERDEDTDKDAEIDRHYDTAAQAVKAGAKAPTHTDVSWNWTIAYDHDLRAIPDDENHWCWVGY